MADVATSTPEQEQEQLAEYESQLADIEQLLQATPEDESLSALKKDLVELVTLTRTTLGIPTPTAAVPPPPPPLPDQEQREDVAQVQVSAVSATMQAGTAAAANSNDKDEEEVVEEDSNNNNLNNSTNNNNKKKRKKLRDFVLPEHLIPLDTDTEAERNKKRRTAKALKNKYRQKKKEVESDNKQKDWQSFQKKTKSGGGSIFATQEGVADRVGVISKKQMTDFEGRKRHKHE
jgi:survival-of-motor-neuron-related-splicing factor 30